MRLSLKYGIFTAIHLILYFLLISLFGLHSNPLYSLFNVVILFMGTYFALRESSKGTFDLKYLDGAKTGLATGIVATLIFTVFFAIYIADKTEFMEELTRHMGMEVGYGAIIFTVAIMGFCSSMVTTLALMQYFKRKLKATKL